MKSKLKAATITAGDVAPRTGGRGLKCYPQTDEILEQESPPAQGGVD